MINLSNFQQNKTQNIFISSKTATFLSWDHLAHAKDKIGHPVLTLNYEYRMPQANRSLHFTK